MRTRTISLLICAFAVVVMATVLPSTYGAGSSIEMTIEPELPDAGEEAKLTFVGKTADGEIWDHIDFRIIVHRMGEEIFNHEFHTHAGVLELVILPEATDFTIEIPEEESEHEEKEEVHEGEEHEEESLPPVDTTIEPGEREYIIKGPLFLDKADYTITAQIIGIEFNPLPPDAVVTQEFGVQVIPEFPLALFPMVFGFVALISILRFKNKLHSL